MRPASALSILALPLAVVGARLKQYHPPRAVLDTCLSISTTALLDDLHLSIPGLPGGILSPPSTDVNICLCLSALPLAIQSNVQLSLLADFIGTQKLTSLLEKLLSTSDDCQQCSYPPNSTPACESDDPCAYQCKPPYVSQYGQCTCPPPNQECNGVCGYLPQGCSSGYPHYKRNAHLPAAARHAGITTYRAALATCKVNEDVCGIPAGGIGSRLGFECLNTHTELESCGGCVTPHSFVDGPIQSEGSDCTLLANVADVACVDSRCVISRCNEGYRVGLNGTDICVQVEGLGQHAPVTQRRRRGALN